ncbi:MAG TPA: hypothetical protein VKY62_00305 [Devosia sp.]|nr:hypothetical protein [Devosia sp.]
MTEVRRRAAIGIFATAAELDAVAARLTSQGISGCMSCPLAQAVAEMGQGDDQPALSAATLSDLHTRFPTAMMLRVDLSGNAKEEAMVAQTLLSSAAQSVQLHDL